MDRDNNRAAPQAESAPRKKTGRALKHQNLDPAVSLDLTIKEVMALRREGESTVWRKMRSGVYTSYKNRDKRLITRESVLADRERCLAEGPRLTDAPTGGRPPGRPKTPKPPSASAAE